MVWLKKYFVEVFQSSRRSSTPRKGEKNKKPFLKASSMRYGLCRDTLPSMVRMRCFMRVFHQAGTTLDSHRKRKSRVSMGLRARRVDL
ncbi:hypothetical protein NDU88_006225 [Pleurodeles waltl]|uniref:Uncharacterized protein n=1 Tax=Pleurodeles waltl TaxID=8319 RepID=A0AAV7X206_PLEWA|nr:hypothetical protein NDU88_006225 [Pleurodeles waltl]